jgi:hypothetical protein
VNANCGVLRLDNRKSIARRPDDFQIRCFSVLAAVASSIPLVREAELVHHAAEFLVIDGMSAAMSTFCAGGRA